MDLLDIAHPAVRELEADKPAEQRAEEANKEEDCEAIINLPLRELSRRANYTPNNAGSAEYLRRWANETVLLGGIADFRNITEHPCLYPKLNGTSDDGGNDLGPKHRLWRNLHVVTELEIRREGEGLSHSDVTPRLEHHHGDRAAGEAITNDELGDNVQTNLLVGDGLDHADGNDIEEGDDESEDEPLDRELSLPTFNDGDTECEHAH